MIEITHNKTRNDSNLHYFEDRQMIMKLNSTLALNFILNHPNSRELVRSFSEENFYFLLHNIGIDNCNFILALASNSQWEYFLDVEIWEKDSLNYFHLTNLLIIMMDADPNRFSKWCFYENFNFMELYLFRNLEIKILDINENFPNLGSDFFTNDGIFYLKFVNYSTSYEDEQIFLEKRDIMLRDMLVRFSNMDYSRYQALLMEVIGVISAELEEEMLRLKTIRLAEKGFLPFHEAINIYYPLKLEALKKRNKKIISKKNINHSFYPVPHFSDNILSDQNWFIKALRDINDDVILHNLEIEFVSLCNLLIAADDKKVRNIDELRKIVKKASGFINIGIETIMKDMTNKNVTLAVDIIKNWSFENIFRVGYDQVFNLSRKAINWYKISWFRNEGLKLYFWEEEWFGILSGLLLDKPMLFNKNNDLSKNYQEFKKCEEIDKVSKKLEQIIVIDNIFSLFKVNLSLVKNKKFINVSNLLLTMWLLHYIDSDQKIINLRPISLTNFKLFYSELWEKSNNLRKLKDSKKNEFLAWIGNKINKPSDKNKLSRFFENLLLRVENEFNKIKTKDLESKYIELFIVGI